MSVINVEIPDELNAALQTLSTQRHLSPAALLLELLEQNLPRPNNNPSNTAENWLLRWRGSLSEVSDDERLAYLLQKHLLG